MPQRRTLDFRSFDEVTADVDHLAATPHDRCGRWDLATICDHLAKGMEVALDNKPIPLPIVIKLLAPLAGPAIFRRTLKTRRMPTGVKAPPPFVPSENCDCTEAITHLKATIARARAFPGPMPRHPVFGQITPDQWREFILIHCAHHLSFLVPRAG
jgi:hypothetical protein